MVRVTKRKTVFVDTIIEAGPIYYYKVDYDVSTLYGKLTEDSHLTILAGGSFEVHRRRDKEVSIEAEEITAEVFEAVVERVRAML